MKEDIRLLLRTLLMPDDFPSKYSMLAQQAFKIIAQLTPEQERRWSKNIRLSGNEISITNQYIALVEAAMGE